ncbi:MAG: efflux RND transporter periplasmic adaptor subunit [Flavobacteriales bacterium]|nr:efflux RND transporter periplasmic adaptor subunit [Flavobacteriales bacterium]
MKTKILLIVGITLGITACKKSKKEELPNDEVTIKNQIVLTKEQEKTAGVESGYLLKTVSPGVIYCNGIIDVPPDAKASIYVPVAGFIQHVYVLPGDKVTKGQRLVSMQHPDYISLQKQYIEVTSQLKLAEKELERQATLKSDNATTGRLFDKAEADVKVLKSQAGAIEAQLFMLGINPTDVLNGKIYSEVILTAPFSGYIGSFTANTGKYIRQDEEIMTVLNKEHLHAELRVFEKDILKVKENQPVYFKLTGSNKIYEAYVKLIGKEVEPVSRTVQVHAHIDKKYPEIVNGMFVNAEIHTSADSVYVIPESALMEEGGHYYCMVDLGQHTYEMQEVLPGSTHDGQTEVLNADEFLQKKVVLKGAYSLFAIIKKSKDE